MFLGIGQAAYQAAIEEAEPVGVITIEDVIEELIGGEILDETDRFVDNLKRERVISQPIFSKPLCMPDHCQKRIVKGMSTSSSPKRRDEWCTGHAYCT
jgi:hypothetical protein